MKERVSLSPIANSEGPEFLRMAERYFTELNPQFVARDDWRSGFFSRRDPDLNFQWILAGARRAGFAIFGKENHRFLPLTTGCVYEFYVLLEFRRTGVGRDAAKQVMDSLRRLSPSKIQLEIAQGNAAAAEFWQTMGFRKVSERYVLRETPQ